MDQWYLQRNQQMFGPYSSQQLAAMAASGQLYAGDRFAPAGSSTWLDQAQASAHWQAALQQPQTPKPRKRHGCLVTFLVILVLVGGLISWKALTKKSDNLSLGKPQVETSETIGTNGGTLTVSDPDSPIDGLVLDVPADAYDAKTRFEISTQEITGDKFGSRFTPVSPLITIDNGHAFADQAMTLTIPIESSPGKFVMGFYYNQKTGELEGLPFSEISNDHITVLTNHFSDIVVAETDLENLKEISVDTGFRPGVDDWQFVNRGSWIAPGGHCAGQTISMMWYYSEIYQGNSERRLYGRFDNNSYGIGTIDFWRDDSLGYRFASVIQSKIDWGSKTREWINKNINTNAANTYCAFAFSMMMTGEPQYMSIRGDYTDPSTGTTQNVGHAIAVYRADGGTLYVSDPNYPGSAIRTVRFDGSNFQPYNSGLNAEAIAETGEISFNQIFYCAKTALIDYSTVADQYKKVLDGTVGDEDDLFGKCELERLVRIDPVTGEETWEPCLPDLKLSLEDTAKVDPSLAGKLRVRVKNQYSNMVVQAFYDLNPTQAATNREEAGSDGLVSYTLTLDKGVNHFGFSIDYKNNAGKVKYSDFMRLRILYDQNTSMEFLDQPYQAIVGLETSFKATVKDAPSGIYYLWDFGDGSEVIQTKKPVADHVYDTAGSHTISLSMVRSEDLTVMAECEALVDVVNFYGDWQLNYTIEESGAIDSIINMIVKVLVEWIAMIFDTDPSGDYTVTLEGTVIGCQMAVSEPATEGGDLQVLFQQVSSSTDFVEVTGEVWRGKMEIDGDKVVIRISAEDQTALVFKGTLLPSGLEGSFDAGIMSGSFRAWHR